MAEDSTLTILQHLPTLLIHLKVLGLRLQEFLVSGGALLILCAAGFGEDPGPGGSGIEYNLKLLRRRSEPERALVTHILEIFHGNINYMSFVLDKGDISIFTDDGWNIQSLRNCNI
jgi:hypothetical protein